MIRHIVLVKFRPEMTEAEIAALFADLGKITQKLSGALDIRAGKSESPEQIERGYLHGFTIDFEDWQALSAYQDHPDHRRLGARLVASAVGGLDGILVFDLSC
ncbi:Dabb family protein [Xinfangfangia sp. CPCC 101601]|uniref:Dabb family protein n=1 Tax=Pseudogemmobacter lacusdianii TaxID=3069608 RepID=A0ABU0VT95_9RHOB|nr:Dabb family protein [Xinfangfangia sp. CPCC 101601]MDQ2064957.1 Dabb family protein [Xinfangfangia sp. CPCC 101601]